jgi:hypothetical protein
MTMYFILLPVFVDNVFFIVVDERLFLCAETIGIDVDDDGRVVEDFGGFFVIHCSIVFE